MAAFPEGLPNQAADPPTEGCEWLAAHYDWSESGFGPKNQWAPAVEAIVRTLLEAAAPMAYCHGPEYAMVYNDQFADMLGARHPRAWGQQAAAVMPEIWSRPGYAGAVERVFAGGPSFHDDGEMLGLQGREQTHPDWAYLARSYSAVRDSQGSVLGILVVVVETAPVLVLVGGGELGAARWRGTELWDETGARGPLIWSGFRASAGSPVTAVAEPDQRFVAEDHGQLILPTNGPDVEGVIGYLGMRRHLPDVQMVTLAARDQDDSAGTPAGNEFYDVVSLPDGRLAVAIGDVRGVGPAAPGVTKQIRAGLRRAALTSTDPGSILSILDELVSRLDAGWTAGQGPGDAAAATVSAGFGGELFVTALLGVFDPATGEFLIVSAGHPQPVLVRRRVPVGASETREGASQAKEGLATGSRRLAEFARVEAGPPLGITGERPVHRLVLEEGDALVAFTDGLLKVNGQSLDQRQGVLLQTVSSMSSTAPRSISQHIVDEMVGSESLDDDCTLLVVVRDSRVHQMASVLIPPHAIAVRGARRWVGEQLESWGLDEELKADAVLAVSELVTNVGLHAGTTARVTMELADRLLVTVEDTGTWGAPRPGREDHSASRGRGLALVAALSDAMGHARGVDGSTVWFEIALDRKSR